jgi:transcriptional regulator with XRE-family HTH domain
MASFQKTIQREARRQRLTGYRIGKLSGVPIRTVQRYLAGDTDLAGRRIEKIAEVLGLELQAVRHTKKGG